MSCPSASSLRSANLRPRLSIPASSSDMPLNPLAPVTDYQSMLNRIFWFTTATALAAIWFLRHHIPALDESLSKVDFAVAVGAGKVLPTPAGYLLPALAVGIAAHIFRLHTRI